MSEKGVINQLIVTSLNKNIQENLEWYKSYGPSLNKFLEDNVKDDEDDSASSLFVSFTLIITSLFMQYLYH